MAKQSKQDNVNHPKHYTEHPSGIECIEITEHFNFCLGNAIKYIWRAGLKSDRLEDLRKARFYVDREIAALSCHGYIPWAYNRVINMAKQSKPKGNENHPSGIECIQITEHFNFCLGSAIECIWMVGLKNGGLEDLKKARGYINREISTLEE